MPDTNILLKDSPSLTGNYDVDYDKLLDTVRTQAQQVRQVSTPSAGEEAAVMGSALKSTSKQGGIFGGLMDNKSQRYAARSMITSAIADYNVQKEVAQKEAEKSAKALEMMGEATVPYLQNIEAITDQAKTDIANAKAMWTQTVEKADEYVQQGVQNIQNVLADIDDISESIIRDSNYGRAHAMQAAVQAAIGASKDVERRVAEQYGVNSKEYQATQAAKIQTLTAAQSRIEDTYAQLEAAQRTSLLNARVEITDRMYMYQGYKEQLHINTMGAASAAMAEYSLQQANLSIASEQLKYAGLENLANWMVQTPIYSVSLAPIAAAAAAMASSATLLDVLQTGIAGASLFATPAGGMSAASAIGTGVKQLGSSLKTSTTGAWDALSKNLTPTIMPNAAQEQINYQTGQ